MMITEKQVNIQYLYKIYFQLHNEDKSFRHHSILKQKR